MLFLLSILHDQQLHTAIKHFAKPEEATNFMYVCISGTVKSGHLSCAAASAFPRHQEQPGAILSLSIDYLS